MKFQQGHFVSIIIPVYNNSGKLQKCLDALNNQTYSKNLYEIIVVDNGSDEKIDKIVNQYTQAILTYEDNPGSYAARNKGIALSKGNIIAFTDSDCIPAKDWIEKGVKRILDVPNCGLVAGRINLFFKNPKRLTAVELMESITAYSQKEFVEKERYGATANVFTFKSVIDKVGFFNDKLKSGGDTEWGYRVFLHGYK